MQQNIITSASVLFFLAFSFSLGIANDRVIVEGNLVSINVNNVSLDKILTEIHHKTNIIFHVDDRVEYEIISMTIEKKSLENILTRLLKSYDKILIYGNNGDIERIGIFRKGEKTLTTNGENNTQLSGTDTIFKDNTILVLPSDLDPEMKVTNSEEGSHVLDISVSKTKSDMNITESLEGGMEIILPEQGNKTQTNILTD